MIVVLQNGLPPGGGRYRSRRRRRRREHGLDDIVAKFGQLPQIDARDADEIIGYDAGSASVNVVDTPAIVAVLPAEPESAAFNARWCSRITESCP